MKTLSMLPRRRIGTILLMLAGLGVIQFSFYSTFVGDNVIRSYTGDGLFPSSPPANGTTLTTLQQAQQSPYAYVFLLGNCGDPRHPHYYRGFLYNVLVSARILRHSDARADIVVMVHRAQRAFIQALPEEAWLHEMGCLVWYIDIDNGDDHVTTFRETTMLKFRVLQLTHYRRVLFLDGDVTPNCNLDYMFQLSDRAYFEQHYNVTGSSLSPSLFTLQPNAVVAWTQEPANGGFFLLAPVAGDYEELQGIIATQRCRAQNITAPPHFNKTLGWGHIITAPDHWQAVSDRVDNAHPDHRHWDFYGAYMDQGLLYHWVKYVKRNVSIFTPGHVQTWTATTTTTDGKTSSWILNQTALHESALLRPLACLPWRGGDGKFARSGGYKKPSLRWMSHPTYGMNLVRHVPYNTYTHFYATFKPWRNNIPNASQLLLDPYQAKSAHDFWWSQMGLVNQQLSLGLWRNGTWHGERVTTDIAAPRWVGVA